MVSVLPSVIISEEKPISFLAIQTVKGKIYFNGKEINISCYSSKEQSIEKIEEMAKKGFPAFSNLSTADFMNIEEVLLDFGRNKMQLIISDRVLEIALNTLFKSSFTIDTCTQIFTGNSSSYRLWQNDLKDNLSQAFLEKDFSKVIQLLSHTTLPINKTEIIKFFVQHRMEFDKLVCKKEREETNLNDFIKEIKDGDRTFYSTILRDQEVAFVAQKVLIYELREVPFDSSSPLIGYARVLKNEETFQGKNLEEDEIIQKYKRIDRASDIYTIGYLLVNEKYRDKGFSYIILHSTIMQLLENQNAKVNLVDGSFFKVTKLYYNVNEFVQSNQMIGFDFKHSASDRSHTYYL